MRNTIILSFFYFLSFLSVKIAAQNTVVLKTHFDLNNTPKVPDYFQNEAWAALPTKIDAADKTPLKSNLSDKQNDAKADVFFFASNHLYISTQKSV